MRSSPLFDEDQWRVVCALEQAGKAFNIVPMPGTRLQHWFRDVGEGLLADAEKGSDPVRKKLAKDLAWDYFKMTLPLALVKVDLTTKHLGLVIADDDRAIHVPGGRIVEVISWSKALDYLHRGQVSALIDMAENIVACGRAQAEIAIHQEEAALKMDISRHLHLAWPGALDRSALDADTVEAINAVFAERREMFALYREVAVSRIINLGADEVVDRDMRRVFNTSDVDFVIHGRPPYNVPLFAIEYDGDEHRTPDKMAIDRAKDRLFERAGIALLRIGTDLAAAKRARDVTQERHRRLAPMLAIAGVILGRKMVEHVRAAEDKARMPHIIAETGSIARALYDKPLTELNPSQRLHALSLQQMARRDEDVLLDAERGWEDFEEESSQSLAAQLEDYGVDPTWVSDDAIRTTPYGKVGKARLKLNDGSAVRSIETVAVSLNAPGLPAETVERLVRMQVYAELAYKAFELVRAGR
jgi:hypothetical protein